MRRIPANWPPSRHIRLSSQLPPCAATMPASDRTSPVRSLPIMVITNGICIAQKIQAQRRISNSLYRNQLLKETGKGGSQPDADCSFQPATVRVYSRADFENAVMKIVLAYSGGLDT